MIRTEFSRANAATIALIGGFYLAAYVALDWVSSMHTLQGLAITPWSPPAGLSLALLLLFGLRMAPLLFVAYVAADFAVRGMPVPATAELASAAVPPVAYAAAAWALARWGFEGKLRRVGEVARLAAVAGVAALVAAAGHVAVYRAFGQLPAGDALAAMLRFWIGDFIGIVVFTPLILRAIGMRFAVRSWGETIAQIAALVGAWWLVFGWQATDEFKFFYILFIPAMWISLRAGMTGAVLALAAVQIGLIYATTVDGKDAQTVIELQILMLCLALSSLLTAAAVEERRTQEAARQALREQIGHLGRISLSGEIAAAVTHELNQPLTAFVNYLRAARHLANAGDRREAMLDALSRADAQAVRAGQTLHRLREFLRRGEMLLSAVDARRIVADAAALLETRARRAGVDIEIAVADDAPAVVADRIQATQVLVNLIVNAIEAIEEARPAEKFVRISVARTGDGRVLFAVEDSGPGVPDADRERVFDSFYTTRRSGMGLGLAISRTLIEAQGGRIACRPATARRRGAFEFELPEANAS